MEVYDQACSHSVSPYRSVSHLRITHNSWCVSTYQANQHHLISFMEQKEISSGLKEIKLWTHTPVRDWKVPVPLPLPPSTGFVPFATIRVINPLAATKGRAGAGSRWWIFITLPATSRNLTQEEIWTSGHRFMHKKNYCSIFTQGHGPWSTCPKISRKSIGKFF